MERIPSFRLCAFIEHLLCAGAVLDVVDTMSLPVEHNNNMERINNQAIAPGHEITPVTGVTGEQTVLLWPGNIGP